AWVEVSGPRDYYTGRINGQPEAIRDDLYNTQRSIEKYLVSRQDLIQGQKAAQVLELAQAYFRQGNFAYASFYADRSLNLEESGQGHLLMARLLVAYTQKATQGSPPASDSQDILRAAIKATQVALGLNPRFTEALQLQAKLNLGLGEIEQAILSYQRLVEIDAQNPDAHYTLAALLQAQGRHTEARRHYQKFLLMARQSEAYSGLVDLAQKQLEAMGQRGSR
ncbi:MAG: tetratricopeptide repeat protein, partial [Nitrospiria bacterium]